MREQYKIGRLNVIIDSDKVVFDEEKAYIHKVLDDEAYDFSAITCAARPMEFSIVNRLSNLDRQIIQDACDKVNKSQEIGILSNDDQYLILTPFVDRFTFFGFKEAEMLTHELVDICMPLEVTSLRVTQFCMMRHEAMPIYDQFKGIMYAFTSRKESKIDTIFFDVPDKKFYELNILFNSYTQIHKTF